MRSFPNLAGYASSVLRMAVPAVLMTVLFIFNVIALNVPVSGSVKAPFFLMGIYYWALYRPTLIPSWLVFLAGFAMDFLSGLPPGLNALAYLILQWIATDQRRFLMGQNFIMIWFGFCLLSLAAALGQWAIFGFLQFHWPPLNVLLVSTALGFALFPVVYIFLHLTHKILPSPGAAAHFSS